MFSISLVSRETGISIAALRKWEERYGFPKPVRHNGYTRSYSKQDVAHLHEVKRLLDLGMRPSKLFLVTPSEFSALEHVLKVQKLRFKSSKHQIYHGNMNERGTGIG